MRKIAVSLFALAAVLLSADAAPSLGIEPAFRQAFVRGEEGALYRLRLVNYGSCRHTAVEVAVEQDLADGKVLRQTLPVGDLAPNAATALACPIETRLKPGWRILRVTVRDEAGETIGGGTLSYGIGPAVLDRGIPLFMSHYDFAPASAVADFGFTHAYNKFAKPQEFLIPDPQGVWAKGCIRTFDEAVMCGLRLTAGMDKTEDPDGAKPGEGRCRTRDGQVAWNPRHTHELPDVADPKMVDAFRRLAAAEAEIFGEHPAFVGLLPCTEQRDFSFPDFGTGARLFREATGLEIPAEVRDGAKGRSFDPELARTRYPDGIVPEDDPVLRYYRWFWSGGDGWPGYVGAAAAEYKKRIKRPEFVTYWNPAVRCPPRWGSGGEVDMIDHWCYAEPEPMNVAGVVEEMFAMAAGRPGQKVSIKTQLITYRQQTAPVGKKVSPEPEWLKRLPDARFPTIAPDILSESTWSMFAKPVDVLMYHGWGTVWDHHGKGYYDYTCPAAADRLRQLVKEVLLPLGPAMKLIGRTPSPVAVFESFTSAMMSGAFSWGWKAPVVTMLQRARLDPRVVYEETIVRDGLDGVKVLVAPQCRYLTQDLVDRIRAFQAKGGILVADDELVGALKADVVLPTVSFDPPPESDSYEDVGRQESARNGEERTHQATRKVKERLIAVGNEARRALAAKYVPAADSSSPELVTYARRWKDVDYLFVVNDHRTFGDYVGQWGLVMEKGLPMSGEVSLADPDGKVGAVYELSRGGAVGFSRRDGRVTVPVAFETTDGRVFAFLKRPIARIEAEASKSVAPGGKIAVTLRILDAEGHPVEAVLPVDIRVFDAQGRELDGAGYAAAENGVARIDVQTNLDDAPGDYRVTCRERAGGRSCECRVTQVREQAAARQDAAGDAAELRERIARTHTVKAVDRFCGYDRIVFDFDGYEAWVVCPKGEPRKDRAWTWVMQWATAFVRRTNVPQLLAQGYHHVTIDTFRHRMDETGLKVSADFQRYLVDELGFAPKANLIGMSWGGFFSTRYAANYPGNVAKIYLDAPLLCFHEFKIGIGPWENRQPAGGWRTSPEMPVNMAERLAAAKIPILLLYGGKDTTCPPAENCEPFAERFRAAGGEMESLCRGIYGHHPHGVETDETTIADFFNRARPEPLADFTGEPDWPFADGRRVSPVIDLRKPAGENAFYLLTFEAKAAEEGTWLFEALDDAGAPVGEDRSALYATEKWRSYQIPVPVVPEATKARLAFEGAVRPDIRNVRIRKSNPDEAAGLVSRRNARFQQPLDMTAAPGVWAWTRLPDARTAIRVAKDFSIVYVGDEIMNDTWNGCIDAFVRQAFPDTRIRSHVAIAPDGGAAFFAEKGNFDRLIARHRPNLVVLGGVSNNRVRDGKVLSGETQEDIRRFVAACRAIGAETAVCSPAKSADPRKLQDDSPLLASADIRRAARAAGAQFWDVTAAPVGTVRRCPDAVGWHNRGETLNNNRGKVLNALTMAAYFQSANLEPRPYVGAPDEAHVRATRRFTGIPSLEQSPKNGRLWCTWYAGPTSNEDENNYIVLATSEDGGTAWREVLIADPDGLGDRRAFDPEVWIAPDGRLRWTWTERYGDAGDSAADDKVMCVELGAEDLPPEPYPQPQAILPGVMMCKPTALSTGEWLYPVSRWGAAPSSEFYATRDGRVFELRGGATLPEADRLYDEQMVLERTDGELVAFIRTKFKTRLSTSRDGGRTWSVPKEADTFGNFSTRLFVRRLRSGAVLLVKNGRTPTEPARGRAYLTAFLSRDDGRTWEGGLLLDDVAPAAYPDGAEGPDGLIRIVYDHDRHNGQEIFMATFTEEDVRSGKDVSGRCRLRQAITSGQAR